MDSNSALITFKFDFMRGSLDDTRNTGIAKTIYAIEERGKTEPKDYVGMALDYVSRIYWAFDSQGWLEYLNTIYNSIILPYKLRPSSNHFNASIMNSEENIYNILCRPFEEQDAQDRLLAWCDGIPAVQDERVEDKIKVISSIKRDAQFPRVLRNPIKFPIMGILIRKMRPTFNEHIATLNLIIGYTFNRLSVNQMELFSDMLGQIFSHCEENPGFWRHKEGIVNSIKLTDRILSAYPNFV